MIKYPFTSLHNNISLLLFSLIHPHINFYLLIKQAYVIVCGVHMSVCVCVCVCVCANEYEYFTIVFKTQAATSIITIFL